MFLMCFNAYVYSFILAPYKAVGMPLKRGKTNFASMEYMHLFICKKHLYLALNEGIFVILSSLALSSYCTVCKCASWPRPYTDFEGCSL